MNKEMALSWYNALNKRTFYITLTNHGHEDRPLFYGENAKIVSHWIDWSNLFIRPEPQNFIIKIGHGQGLSNSIYFTQLQSVLNEVLLLKEKWSKFDYQEGLKTFRLQISHEWTTGYINNDIIRELKEIATLYKEKGINITLNLYIDVLAVEANGFNYKVLKEFVNNNINNNVYNIVTLKNIQYAGEQTKTMLNVLSGFLKNQLIMNIFLALHHSNSTSEVGDSFDYLSFYKYLKTFCPKGFMEMITGDFMDFQRAIKNGGHQGKVDGLIIEHINKCIIGGVVINSINGFISPIVNPQKDDYKVIDGFYHSELKNLTADEIRKKFQSQFVDKVISSPCANCSKFNICITENIWMLNIVNKEKTCSLGLLPYIKTVEVKKKK